MFYVREEDQKIYYQITILLTNKAMDDCKLKNCDE